MRYVTPIILFLHDFKIGNIAFMELHNIKNTPTFKKKRILFSHYFTRHG